MDGGALIINDKGGVETVWRRKAKIYACAPGQPEQEIGEGKGVTMESVHGKTVYAWMEKGEIIVVKPQGIKEQLGKGSGPIIKAVNDKQIICVWENDKQIQSAIVPL
jgi:hypothetical protein